MKNAKFRVYLEPRYGDNYYFYLQRPNRRKSYKTPRPDKYYLGSVELVIDADFIKKFGEKEKNIEVVNEIDWEEVRKEVEILRKEHYKKFGERIPDDDNVLKLFKEFVLPLPQMKRSLQSMKRKKQPSSHTGDAKKDAIIHQLVISIQENSIRAGENLFNLGKHLYGLDQRSGLENQRKFLKSLDMRKTTAKLFVKYYLMFRNKVEIL